MSGERDLVWDGCFNVRDLGGFRTLDGGKTRRGAIVRSDALSRLSVEAWRLVLSHGIRTVIDLRNEDELDADISGRPRELTTVNVPIDDLGDRELWDQIWSNKLDGSPLYFRLFLERKPQQCASAVRAIANAEPGGVVFHCGRGRDRTGLVALLVLALAGVDAEHIASDYELSTERVRRLDAALGEADQGAEIAGILRRKGTSARAVILDLLKNVDIEERLRAGGLQQSDLDRLRERFVVPTADPTDPQL